ncbi:MAG: hypothetical protein JWL83_3335 [Actinomycetia bacterium]|nr:hypothetical protein [Actinomycetes bacterium]
MQRGKPRPGPDETARRGGILAGAIDVPARLAAEYPAYEAAEGLPVVHRASGFAGTVVSLDADALVLRGATGLERRFRNDPGGFMVDAIAVRLVASRPREDDGRAAHLEHARVLDTKRTASGSRAVAGAKARVARASRILVEGVHDAELVEKVWGDDLRIEGVVVERLDGADVLPDVVRAFEPSKPRRLGVLLDHLVAGSKESRLAAAVSHPQVLVVGTPYIDVWQAVRPRAVGIEVWPVVPKGVSWKDGVCAALGWPDPRAAWRRILDSVTDWGDLEQPFVGAVESLIDFVTAGEASFTD